MNTHEEAVILRQKYPWTAPVPVLKRARTIGLGDRLGIATPGHIRAIAKHDVYPVFAQQSVRELTLTNRTFDDVLDCVTFAVYNAGYTRGFGFDGDHLKTEEEISAALKAGCTMITLDCSEHIRKGGADAAEIYGGAIEFAARIYERFFRGSEDKADFELSIDETDTPTTPEQHLYIATELKNRGITPVTVAPRFCGEFQKGIDYIGDLAQFDREIKIHAEIAERFGYKLSIHSGSDKFSVFPSVGKYTGGHFHVKTAGTNWLEAMRVVAETDPALYREVHKYALARFADAKAYYHVTTDLARIPDADKLPDGKLPELFSNDDARQLIHITYGFILTDGGLRGRLYKLWSDNAELYAKRLEEHIGRHLELLYR
ncbi:hypothetical protein FACS1894202_13970 [Clostridia bacterium]|nr:hypothetical protein FACS1894202_13970 [Clostridia bacterium]